MPEKTKQSLEAINNISRQLLSCMSDTQKEIKEGANTNIKLEHNATEEPNQSLNNKYDNLTKMVTNREQLIHEFFEQQSEEKSSLELDLLNEMIRLDTEIIQQSKACKLALSQHVIRLKKSKKVKKSYQKY